MKKLLVILLAVMNIVPLTGCSDTDSEIATMRGGKIRVDDLYQQAFRDPTLGRSSRSRKQANEQALREMIIKKVFLEAYGEKVTKTMIEDVYKEQEETHGGKEQFEKALQVNRLTSKDFKKMIKETLAIESGLRANMEIGEAELAAAWNDFHPSVDAQLIQVSEESKAKEILEELQKKDSVFEEVAEEHSEHETTSKEGGKITFDSSTEELPSEVKNVVFSMKNDELSGVIPAIDPSTNQTSYYIVKMKANEGKGNNQEAYLEELTKIAEKTLLDDPEFVSSVIGKELEEADIEIKDERFKDLLSDYLTEDEESDSDEETTESS